jgi:hyperosmotically inducible protein
MKTTQTPKLVLASIISGVMLFASGCASTDTKESTGEYVDDTVITTKVKAKFVEDKTVSALNVNVETFKGVVQLSGFANTTTEADRAVQLARETKGVKLVKNDIRLK